MLVKITTLEFYILFNAYICFYEIVLIIQVFIFVFIKWKIADCFCIFFCHCRSLIHICIIANTVTWVWPDIRECGISPAGYLTSKLDPAQPWQIYYITVHLSLFLIARYICFYFLLVNYKRKWFLCHDFASNFRNSLRCMTFKTEIDKTF